MTESTTLTRITEVRTVAIPSTDQARTLAFYVDKLGFEKRIDAPFGDGQPWIEVGPKGGSASIAIPPLGEGQAAGVDSGVRLQTNDADADHASLEAAGVDVDPQVMRFPGVPAMFSLRDPDGNTLYIVEGMDS